MKFKLIYIISLILIITSCNSQKRAIENRNIDYYFTQIANLELTELLNQTILVDSVTVSEKYRDSSNQMNTAGYQKYFEIKMNVYKSFFKDYLFMQKVTYKNDLYVLYFSMAGFDDMEWSIIKWEKNQWKEEEKLSKEKIKNDSSITKILSNYDEGPKNKDNIRVFIENEYLVMERSNLYHSLYDLKTGETVINEESPLDASKANDKKELNDWIKINLHDKIYKHIKMKR